MARDGFDFEALCRDVLAYAFPDYRFVNNTGARGSDTGVDIVAYHDNRLEFAAEVKFYRSMSVSTAWLRNAAATLARSTVLLDARHRYLIVSARVTPR